MKHRACVDIVVLSLGLCLLAGCAKPGRQPVKTVDVSGKVTLDGKPLEGVAVHFSSTLNHAGTGVTGADGSYKLTDGAEPGENKVYFTAVDSVSEGDDAGEGDAGDIGEEEAGPKKKDSKVPAKYASAASPAMSFTVPAEGTAAANFDLTSK